MMTNGAINHVQVIDPTGTEREHGRYDLVANYIKRQGIEIPVTFLAGQASKLLGRSTQRSLQRIGRVGARVLPGVGYALLVQDLLDVVEFVKQS